MRPCQHYVLLGLRFSHYDFADVSTSFFQRVSKERKERSEKMSCRKLNVEEDPVAQGSQTKAYGPVVAVNVLHATLNMDSTMRNVQKLLRPDEKALIGEIAMQLLLYTVIFGTLPGEH